MVVLNIDAKEAEPIDVELLKLLVCTVFFSLRCQKNGLMLSLPDYPIAQLDHGLGPRDFGPYLVLINYISICVNFE